MTRPLRSFGTAVLMSLACWSVASAQCVGPDQASVQNAISAASYGDTVRVCAGSATWTAQPQGCTGDSMLCMKRGITLQGGIGGTTTITLSGAAPYGAICYEPDAASISNDTPFVFSGFVLDAGGKDYPEGMLDVSNRSTQLIRRVEVFGNTFRNGGYSGHAILINGPVYGVAYNNRLIDIGTPIKVEGGDAKSWNLGHRAYGTANSFFFEDNTVSFTPSTLVDDFGSTAGQGGSLVFRYNTIDAANNTSGNELFDLHGLQSMSSSSLTCNSQCDGSPGSCSAATADGRRCSSQWSQVKSELYGNQWINLNNKTGGYSYWLVHRGSWLLMFANSGSGATTGQWPQPKYRQYACDESQNPATPAFSQHIQNTYVFNNYFNGANRPMAPIGPLGQWGADYCSSGVGTYTIAENVDYFNLNAAFDGTKGVGCGELASRPATCTPGVAYWATAQSCSDLTEMVGPLPATPISGTLYKCTAVNTWTPHFTPYTYPHPLRGPATPGTVRITK